MNLSKLAAQATPTTLYWLALRGLALAGVLIQHSSKNPPGHNEGDPCPYNYMGTDSIDVRARVPAYLAQSSKDGHGPPYSLVGIEVIRLAVDSVLKGDHGPEMAKAMCRYLRSPQTPKAALLHHQALRFGDIVRYQSGV
jgi:hypothetical protein